MTIYCKMGIRDFEMDKNIYSVHWFTYVSTTAYWTNTGIHVWKKRETIYSDCCLLEAFPPLPFLLPLEDERLELELPEREELLSELPLELLLDEEEDPDLLREREELKNVRSFLI